MLKDKTTEEIMSYLLTTGMLVALFFVIMGGLLYLWQHGSEPFNANWLQSTSTYTSLSEIGVGLAKSAPLAIVQLGVIILVFTQIARVVLLLGFYTAIRDYAFALMSLFILLVICYSFFEHP